MKNFEKECVETFCRIFSGYGLNDLQMKVIANLYLEPGELSMEDLKIKTGYSLASISGTMKILENLGMVERRKRPGSRKVFYFMDKNIIRLNVKKLKAAQDSISAPAVTVIPRLIEKYREKVKDPRSKERIKILESYHMQVNEFRDIIDKWRKDLERLSLQIEKRGQ